MRLIVSLVFLLLVSTVAVFAHRYIWLRVVRDTGLATPWRALASFGIAGLCTLLFVGPVAGRLISGPLGQLGAFAAFTWMGVVFYALVSFGGFDLMRWLWSLGGDGVETSAERRLFIARSLGAGAASVAAAASGAALYNGRSLPVVRHVEVKLKRLPKHLDGFKIVQISDLHVSATIRRPYVERVVAMANDLSPDLVALTGDLVDGDVLALRDDFAPLRELKSRYGSFFCTGNHEYYSGADSWLDELRRIGVRPLRNEHVVVGEREGQQGLVVAGIDDAQAARFGGDHGPDLQRALTGVQRERAVLLLAHQPKAVAEAAEAGVDLQLSGHTHGGQMWPFGYLVRLVQPYVAGLHQHSDETQIYVNVGTGYWGPPMRLGATNEVTCVTLRATDAAT